MAQWIKSKYPGIRYREHATRRHGVRNKPDRYITIFYKLDKKMVQESCGWASQGMTEKKAVGWLAELQENHRRGVSPRTLREKRALAETERQVQTEIEEQAKRVNLTFNEVFNTHYIPHIQRNRRNANSWQRDASLYRLWIGPAISNKSLAEIAAFDLERIKTNMARAGRAPRSIEYALAIVRQVFNFALAHDLYLGKNPAGPTGKVKRPTVDNKRQRYLSRQEATDLLAELTTRSRKVHDMSLLSLHTGMRAGEVFSLTWADVDFAGGGLLLKDTKSNKNRPAFMTETVKTMLQTQPQGTPSDLVFPGRNGKQIVQISDCFNRSIDKLGFNDGIDDRRQRVTFHTLRHTFASWLVENNTDIYLVQKLLGHSDLKLTARYAHVGENALRAAVRGLDCNSEEVIAKTHENLTERHQA
ncbi:tyrosine-type recombinase/integrase [Thermodesulfobacteriota bacterium]